jgi:hypothetical protein
MHTFTTSEELIFRHATNDKKNKSRACGCEQRSVHFGEFVIAIFGSEDMPCAPEETHVVTVSPAIKLDMAMCKMNAHLALD